MMLTRGYTSEDVFVLIKKQHIFNGGCGMLQFDKVISTHRNQLISSVPCHTLCNAILLPFFCLCIAMPSTVDRY